MRVREIDGDGARGNESERPEQEGMRVRRSKMEWSESERETESGRE